MAVLAAAMLLVGTLLEPDEETASLAALVGVDAVELQGAVVTTRSTPHVYLQHEGLLSPPAPTIPSVWQRLSMCEASGNWHARTGNGYYGGLQQDMTFWRRHGGLVFAPRPDLATPQQQIQVAQRGQAVQGWAAWPACSRRLGLRR